MKISQFTVLSKKIQERGKLSEQKAVYWPILRNQYGHVLPCWLTNCAIIWSFPDDPGIHTYTQRHIDRYTETGTDIHREIH